MASKSVWEITLHWASHRHWGFTALSQQSLTYPTGWVAREDVNAGEGVTEGILLSDLPRVHRLALDEKPRSCHRLTPFSAGSRHEA